MDDQPKRGRGRPAGSRDSPLVIKRALTVQEAQHIREDVEVIRAQTQLAAWEALNQQIQNLASFPAKERASLIALALKYSEERRPNVQVNVQTGGGDIVRARLQKLAAGLPPEVIDLVHRRELAGEEIVDAEIVEPDPAEVLHRREA